MAKLTKNRIIGILGVFVITASMLFAGCLDDGGTTERIQLVKNGGQAMMDGLDAETIDAMIGWEPWNANAIVGDKGYTYKNSSEIWDHHPCCALAADYDWYTATANADEVLKRIAWVHMKTTEWMNAAKPTTASNHTELISLATDFTERSEAVVEYALINVDFDHTIDSTGVKTYAQKLEEYEIFNEQKWEDSGFASTDAYVDSVLDDQYITWAVANSDKTVEELKLDEPVEIRFGYLTADLHQLSFWVA
jgi:ABC-type nitrate/sulfonate/bicarbonate transport system substrate-binding protein